MTGTSRLVLRQAATLKGALRNKTHLPSLGTRQLLRICSAVKLTQSKEELTVRIWKESTKGWNASSPWYGSVTDDAFPYEWSLGFKDTVAIRWMSEPNAPPYDLCM